MSGSGRSSSRHSISNSTSRHDWHDNDRWCVSGSGSNSSRSSISSIVVAVAAATAVPEAAVPEAAAPEAEAVILVVITGMTMTGGV